MNGNWTDNTHINNHKNNSVIRHVFISSNPFAWIVDPWMGRSSSDLSLIFPSRNVARGAEKCLRNPTLQHSASDAQVEEHFSSQKPSHEHRRNNRRKYRPSAAFTVTRSYQN